MKAIAYWLANLALPNEIGFDGQLGQRRVQRGFEFIEVRIGVLSPQALPFNRRFAVDLGLGSIENAGATERLSDKR